MGWLHRLGVVAVLVASSIGLDACAPPPSVYGATATPTGVCVDENGTRYTDVAACPEGMHPEGAPTYPASRRTVTDYSSGDYSSGGGTVHVNGYYRRDGTYVRPYYRHAPGGGGRRR